MVVSILAYTLIWRSQTENGKLRRHGANANTAQKKTQQKSSLLVLTFVVFYIVPNSLASTNGLVKAISTGLSHLGLVVDPLMYILLHSAVRPIVCRLFPKWLRRKDYENDENIMVRLRQPLRQITTDTLV